MSCTFVVSRLGHGNLFGKEISEEQIVRTLKKYPLFQVMELFAKIDIMLHITAQGGERFGRMQGVLVNSIMAPSVGGRILRNHSGDIWAVFSRGPLAYLRKLALVNCKFEDSENNIWNDLKSVEISQMFLGANDIINDDDLPDQPVNEDFLSFFIQTYYLNEDSDVKQKLIRAFLMFYKSSAPVGGYNSLEELFIDKIGLKPIEILSICFAIVSPFFSSQDIIAKAPVIIEPNEFFKNVAIKYEIVSKVLGLLEVELEDAKAEIGGKAGSPGSGVNAFIRKPLLKLQKDGRIKYICLDIIGLVDKFTVSTNWLLGNDTKLAKDLTVYRGEVKLNNRLGKIIDKGF